MTPQPRGTARGPGGGGRAACPSLPCWAARAGRAGLSSWTAGLVHGLWAVDTNGARSERRELCLPCRGSPTSLFLSAKCNHFLTWALGEREAALRPPCPCASGPGRSSIAARGRAPGPGMLPAARWDVGNSPWVLQGRTHPGEQNGRIPVVSLGSGSLVHPRVPMRFGGMGTPPMPVLALTREQPCLEPTRGETPVSIASHGRGDPQDPAEPGSGCPRQQLLLVPASHRAQWAPVPGWLRSPCLCPHAPDIHAPGFITSYFRATNFYPIPAWMHSPLPSVSDAAALAQQHAGVPCREGRITSQLQDLDTITWYWLSCRIDPHTRGQL